MRLAVLALLTLAGGLLRFTALDFGLPDKFRPDEEYLVSRAVGFRESANPNFAIYPAAQMYVQHATLRAIAWAEGTKGDFRSAFRDSGFARAHLVGRQLSAGFGTATIPALYWAALPAYGAPTALASAAILTFATIHVRESKYATTDAAAVFWLTVALGMMLRVILRGRRTDSLLAGVLAGLAIATKYPTGAILAGLATAHIGARFREGRTLFRVFRDIRPYIALVATLATLVCATPYLFLDWAQTIGDFRYQRGFLEQGVGNPYAGWGWGWMLGRAFPDGLGPILATFVLAAPLWGCLRPRIGTVSLLAFLLVAAIGITSSRYTFYRYVLVPLPALAIFGGMVVADIRSFLGRRMPAAWATIAVTIGLTLLLVPATIRDYKLNRLLARRDSRTAARTWIEENIPRGSKIAMAHRGVPYGKPQLRGYRIEAFENVAAARRNGVGWVLSDSSILPFYSPELNQEQQAGLDDEAELVFEVDPRKKGTPDPVYDEADAFYVPLRHASSVKRPGPRIRIWKVDRVPDPSG